MPPKSTIKTLLQNTPIAPNIVFVNIDWKEGRHYRNIKTHLAKLRNTITDIVRQMTPTAIVMCEVGEVTKPLSQQQMQDVANTCTSAWTDVATEHVNLISMFTAGEPYMTIHTDGRIQFKEQRILHDLLMQTDNLALHKHLSCLIRRQTRALTLSTTTHRRALVN